MNNKKKSDILLNEVPKEVKDQIQADVIVRSLVNAEPANTKPADIDIGIHDFETLYRDHINRTASVHPDMIIASVKHMIVRTIILTNASKIGAVNADLQYFPTKYAQVLKAGDNVSGVKEGDWLMTTTLDWTLMFDTYNNSGRPEGKVPNPNCNVFPLRNSEETKLAGEHPHVFGSYVIIHKDSVRVVLSGFPVWEKFEIDYSEYTKMQGK